MAFESLEALGVMNGHGLYVWPAFIVVLGLLMGFTLLTWLERRQLLRHIAALERRENATRQRGPQSDLSPSTSREHAS